VSGTAALQASGIVAGYGSTRVLFGVDLDVRPSEIVSVLGRNGAGKSTLLSVLAGHLKPEQGNVTYFGSRARSATDLARRGIGYMPQEGCVFPNLTVADNLRMSLGASLGRALRLRGESVERAFDLFPRLRERLNQRAGRLSGGERKLLSVCRLLLSDASVLVLDEPTEGVWPSLIDEIAARLRDESQMRAILVVEQNLTFAAALGGRCYVLDRGSVLLTGDTATLCASGQVADLLAF
jgi:ABC-type branched-subunit amino acid transport system ATPase component